MKRSTLVSAILVRLAYAIHGSVMIAYYLVYTHDVDDKGPVGELQFYVGETLIFFLILESYLTLRFTNGEWKWFLPSVFLYLIWVVPVIITLESHAMNYRIAYKEAHDEATCSITFVDECSNSTEVFIVDDLIVFDAKSHERARMFSLVMMQTMMLVLIVGRWLGPKGTLTRDQLSQLLLAYMGMAADMLEFATETLKMPATACEEILVYFVLGAWAWSLLQFTLGLTATKQRKPRVVSVSPGLRAKIEPVPYNGPCSTLVYCCETEIWALLVSVIMQDGPYLVIRLYIMFTYNDFGQTTIFFTCKNGILFMLQMYRMYVVIIHRNDDPEKEGKGDDKSKAMKVVKAKSPKRKGNGKKIFGKIKKSPPKKSSPLKTKKVLKPKSFLPVKKTTTHSMKSMKMQSVETFNRPVIKRKRFKKSI